MHVSLAALLGVAISSTAFCQSYTIKTIAGGGLPENILGTLAHLGPVPSVATDGAGKLYFALSDYDIILVLDPSTGLLKRLAGNGIPGFSGDNGPATEAQLNLGDSSGVAVDSSGNLYITDTGNQRIRKVSNGVIRTVAGNGLAGFGGDDGPATSAQLNFPGGIAVDTAANLYIADANNHRIRKVSNGTIATVAGGGRNPPGDNGPATNAVLNFPAGVAADSSGNLYVADTYNHLIRKVSGGVITTVAGVRHGSSGVGLSCGGLSGTLAINAWLNFPRGVAVDSSGNFYIAGYQDSCVTKVSNGVITRVAGTQSSGFSDNLPASFSLLSNPRGVAVDSGGNLYVADTGNARVRKISLSPQPGCFGDGCLFITTVAGKGAEGFIGDDGPATTAQLNIPFGVAVDSSGRVYIADLYDHRVRSVWGGVISTVAGNGTRVFSGDNGPATSAALNYPTGVAVDAAANLYIADGDNDSIRKVSGGVITTVAGMGSAGFSGDNGPATNARLNAPSGVAVDSAGNLYIADTENHRVRKVSGGVITTVAGNGTPGFSGDNGPANNAQLNLPCGVAVDSSGDLYIADTMNHRIRKVSRGVITTVVGNGTPGFSGDNGLAADAKLNQPCGVTVDSAGGVYVADTFNQRIRKVSGGLIATIAGSESLGFSGDDGPATNARLGFPVAVAVDQAGNVYIGDGNNRRVRVLTPALVPKNSASYAPGALSPDMIAYADASGIASELVVTSTDFWPTELAGVRIEIVDSQGRHGQAPIYFVAPNAAGYLVPAGTALGHASLTLTTASGKSFAGVAEIGSISPGLYTANSSGSGVAAGFWVRAAASGARSQGYLFDLTSRNPVPVDLGPASDQVYLSLYGTGFRGAKQATATVGGINVPVYGFASVAAYQGEDVVNIGPLPQSLAGRGEIRVSLTFDGLPANTVTVSIR